MKKSRVRKRQGASRFPSVRLLFVPSLADPDGEPRVALEVPPQPGALSRRPVLTMFGTMAAALIAKRELEARR